MRDVRMFVRETVASQTHHLHQYPSRNIDALRGLGDVELIEVDSRESTL